MTSKPNKIELDRHKQNLAGDKKEGWWAKPNLCDSWKWERETWFRRWKIPNQCCLTEAHYEIALTGESVGDSTQGEKECKNKHLEKWICRKLRCRAPGLEKGNSHK